jgi:alkylation response protein AidB-like acyl-CoA dehydrogenase
MNFQLDAEQAMLRDSVRQWVAKNYSFNRRREISKLSAGFSHDNWRQMGELGWLGVSMPEEVGGLGFSLIEAALIAEELGRALVLEPYVPVSVLAAHIIDRAALDDQRADWLSALISGDKLFAVAHAEQNARDDLAFVEARAVPVGGAWQLSGAKSFVPAAGSADLLLISARTSGSQAERSGLSLFAVAPSTSGLRIRNYRTIDGGQAADLEFHDLLVPSENLIGRKDEAIDAIEYGYQRAITVLCAEAVGMMDQALWLTRDYLQTRRQFGVAIGSFQALQHRAADMYVEVQVARAALWRALALLTEADPAIRRQAIQSAKAQVGRAARFVCSQAVQLHGGIAITEEFAIGHYFKRMCVFDLMYGNTNSQLRNLARELKHSDHSTYKRKTL